MKIIVGLGNIGEKYVLTRHNCGFIVLDQLTTKWEENTKLKAIIAKIPEKDLLLAKPTTLMNNSGEAVSKILSFFKETPENLIIIHDDIDLPLGTIRIRDKGSAGTHNGMKSVIEQLGTENFTRIRIGIESRGELTPEQQDLASYVLANFTEKEVPILKKSVQETIKELKQLISY